MNAKPGINLILILLSACSTTLEHPGFLTDIEVRLRQPLPPNLSYCDLKFEKEKARKKRCEKLLSDSAGKTPSSEIYHDKDCIHISNETDCFIPGASSFRSYGRIELDAGPPVLPWAAVSHIQNRSAWYAVLEGATAKWGAPDAVAELACNNGGRGIDTSQYYPGFYVRSLCGYPVSSGTERIAMWNRVPFRAWVQHLDSTGEWLVAFAHYDEASSPTDAL